DAVGHVLVVHRARRVVVTADAADTAGDEVRVARGLALHEDAVTTEDRRRAVALDDLLLAEVDLRVDAQAAHDPGDGIPVHLHNAGTGGSTHGSSLSLVCGAPARGLALVMSQVLPSSPGFLVTGEQVIALLAPPRLLVGRLGREAAEGADNRAVQRGRGGGHPGAGRFVHERHELVREAGHRAGDADTAHVGAAADPVDPASLGHVALDHRAPAAQLDQALGRPVVGREVALLVVPGPVAALVHGRAEQPRRP